MKQSSWQLDLPYLHTGMALPERHTEVSIHGFIEITSNNKVYPKNHHFIFYKIKTRDKQLVSSRTSTAAFRCTILTVHTYFD